MALSLVSVNIEIDKHLDTVLPFLREQSPDVVCIQELLERDIPLFEEICGPCVSFAPMCFVEREGVLIKEGAAIFSRKEAQALPQHYYVGTLETIRLDNGSTDTGTHALVGADIDGYRILTTHFTWTPKGSSTEEQKQHAESLLAVLGTLNEFALCGDFNAPRKGETATLFRNRLTDNIPEQYETSIDIHLHRAGKTSPRDFDDKMVDYLFTTPAYTARDVRLQFGVSDHAAIVAMIEKTA